MRAFHVSGPWVAQNGTRYAIRETCWQISHDRADSAVVGVRKIPDRISERENFSLDSATCPPPPLSLSFLWFFSVKMGDVQRVKSPKDFASAYFPVPSVARNVGHGLVHCDVC